MLYNCCVRIKFWIDFLYVFAVEAYTASWIEIPVHSVESGCPIRSRLIQPRGLKCVSRTGNPPGKVEAYTASWIEICAITNQFSRLTCRGLYSLVDWNVAGTGGLLAPRGRGLYSLVDWNRLNDRKLEALIVEAYTASWIEIFITHYLPPKKEVEAYTASWIEIKNESQKQDNQWRRGLYSLVDWNPSVDIPERSFIVEAYTASWIEISTISTFRCCTLSRLIQPRGLKLNGIILGILFSPSRLIQPRGLKYNKSYGWSLQIVSRLIQPRGLK